MTTNAHGTPNPETWSALRNQTDEWGWRPPQLDGRKEQTWLDDNGARIDGFREHPLGHVGPYAEPFRTCWYCGSIHPDDLLTALLLQGDAPAYDMDSRPMPVEGEEYMAAYRRWVKAQHDYRGGLRLSESDWKYGYPHKFYVEGIVNPLAVAGVTVCSGGKPQSLDPTDHYLGPAPATTHAKFYTEHLADATDFNALAARINAQAPHITFAKGPEGIKWQGHRGVGVR